MSDFTITNENYDDSDKLELDWTNTYKIVIVLISLSLAIAGIAIAVEARDDHDNGQNANLKVLSANEGIISNIDIKPDSVKNKTNSFQNKKVEYSLDVQGGSAIRSLTVGGLMYADAAEEGEVLFVKNGVMNCGYGNIGQSTDIIVTTTKDIVKIRSSTGNEVVIVGATVEKAGVMTAEDKTKLNGISVGANMNKPTNLGVSLTKNKVTITSSTGESVDLNVAVNGSMGILCSDDLKKLNETSPDAEANVPTNLVVSLNSSTVVELQSSTRKTASNKVTIALASENKAGLLRPEAYKALSSVSAPKNSNINFINFGIMGNAWSMGMVGHLIRVSFRSYQLASYPVNSSFKHFEIELPDGLNFSTYYTPYTGYDPVIATGYAMGQGSINVSGSIGLSLQMVPFTVKTFRMIFIDISDKSYKFYGSNNWDFKVEHSWNMDVIFENA